jgi:hypothetical protein
MVGIQAAMSGLAVKDENYLYLTYYQIGLHALDQ